MEISQTSVSKNANGNYETYSLLQTLVFSRVQLTLAQCVVPTDSSLLSSASSMTAVAARRHYQKALRHLLLIYGVINVGLSVDMGASDNRRVARPPAHPPKEKKKQIVLIKVKDIPYSFSRRKEFITCDVDPPFPAALPSPPACPPLKVIVQAVTNQKG